jgi:hypothetical protein
MVATILVDRPNIVRRAKVAELLDRFRLGNLSRQRNWLPGILINILRTPPTTAYIAIRDAPRGILFTANSPRFDPRIIEPLSSVAIGSGQAVEAELDRMSDWIFAGDVGNANMEAAALRDAIQGYIDDHGPRSVGGLYPVVRLDASGITRHGYSASIPFDGPTFSLSIGPDERWVQRNEDSGKSITLKHPWEIDFTEYTDDHMFDDLNEALRRFRGRPIESTGATSARNGSGQ